MDAIGPMFIIHVRFVFIMPDMDAIVWLALALARSGLIACFAWLWSGSLWCVVWLWLANQFTYFPSCH